MYDDEYRTCRATYATVRICDVSADEVSRELGLSPTSSQRPGDVRHGAMVRVHAWFLTSKGVVESKDARRHIDWLLDQLIARSEVLGDLKKRGAKIELSCYWLSASGHGGPTLSPSQASKLSELGIDLWFDVYFDVSVGTRA